MKLVSVVLFLLLYFTGIGQVTEITRFNSPRTNIWVTIANQTNQSSLCLSLGGITNPFRTCLIGLPVWSPNEFCGLVKNQTWCSQNMTRINSSIPGHTEYQNDGFRQCQIVLSLNTSLLSPPEELDLFGCANASMTNTSQGGWFSFVPLDNRNWDQNKEHWATLHSALGLDKVTGMVYTNCDGNSLQTPRKLPPGIFLICGDRAWNGVPARPQGGPCYLGKLSLFHPNVSLLMQWSHNSTRSRRSIHDLECSKVGTPTFWGDFRRVVTSTLLPAMAASRALNLAKELGCWAREELNKTSEVLDMLTTDVQSVNHAVLQNRAAIDFLLLAQGHGCEEFEGMCCMNLSDHSVSIHTKIKELRDGLHKLKEEEGLGLDEWLKGLGLGPWLRNVVIYAIGLLGVILFILLLLPCVLTCIQGMIQRTIEKTWKTHLLAQKENGGNVERNVESVVQTWLLERGHSQIDLL